METTWAYKLYWLDETKQGPRGILYKLKAERMGFNPTDKEIQERIESGWAVGSESFVNNIIKHYGLSYVESMCGPGFVEFKNYNINP